MKKNNKKHNYEDVKRDFDRKNYTLISKEYKNAKEQLHYICNKHKGEGIQHVSYGSFKQNIHNCKCCKRENVIGVHRNVSKQMELYYDEYFDKYNKKLKEQEDGNEYVLNKVYSDNGKTMLDLIHLKCGKHYHVEQNKFFARKNRCQNPKCRSERKSKQNTRTHESIANQIYDLVQDEYSILSKYECSNKNMKFRHNICNHEFQMTPHNFVFGGQRCPKCAQLKRNECITKTHEEFLKQLEDKHPDEYDVLDKYVNSNTKIRFLHKSCGRISWQSPDKALTNLSICKYCDYPTRGEQKIIEYLDGIMFGEYEYQQYYDDLLGVNDGQLSYDFYIPKYNLLIEYQGEYHDGSVSCQTEEEFEIQQEHDRRKREYAKSYGIDLLEIWYWDFDNIEDILTNYIELYNKKSS